MSEKLPLSAMDGSAFWWVLTDHIIEESEKVIALARRDIIFDRPEYQAAFEEAVLIRNEAVEKYRGEWSYENSMKNIEVIA